MGPTDVAVSSGDEIEIGDPSSRNISRMQPLVVALKSFERPYEPSNIGPCVCFRKIATLLKGRSWLYSREYRARNHQDHYTGN